MEQRLWMILQLIGGAALFLYSMDTLTDALQQAAGDTLRQALARLTAHPLAGVLTGAAVTAVVGRILPMILWKRPSWTGTAAR